MGLVYEYLTFAGKSSEDFRAHISGSGTFISPKRNVENISIPGRNGDLHIDNGKYDNIQITYPAFITDNFRENYEALKAFLLSRTGYEELADSYHPDNFRIARFIGDLNPQMSTLNRAGSFELSFDCDPRFFLKNGKEIVTISGSGQIYNRTLYASKPLIRAYGTGTLTIAGTSVQITSANSYTDIDCDAQEAYKGNANCNGNIILTNGKFPEIPPGLISISLSGLTKIEITPRWWTV